MKWQKLITVKVLRVLSFIFVAALSDSLARRSDAATFLVTNTNDSGAGTLRQAITNSNAQPGSNTIDLTGVRGTITLTSGELLISSGVTITGPGPTLLAVSGNHSSRVFNINGYVTISDLTIKDGEAPDCCPLQSGHDYVGGGILSSGSLTLDRCVITGNSAGNRSDANYGVGGGVSASILYLNDCTVSSNTVTGWVSGVGQGGGVQAISLYATRSTFDNNTAFGSDYAQGGGILVGRRPGFPGDGGGVGSASITACTISSNSVSRLDFELYQSDGGGLSAAASDLGNVVTIINTTISGNHADVGGGLSISTSAAIQNSTITGNSPDGIVNFGSFRVPTTVAVQNTIVAGNLGVSDVVASPFGTPHPFISQGQNLIGASAGSDGFFDGGNGDHVGTPASPIDALLGPLQDNGGPTLTRALKPNSPAFNAGRPVGGVSTDQLGQPRISGPAPDIGAFEYQYPSILAQPQGQTVNAGSSVTFTVSANGTAPLFYQWQKDGVAISKETNATFTITSVAPIDPGLYAVVVSNTAGSVTSDTATLTVDSEVVFRLQQAAYAVAETNSSFKITVIKTGSNPASVNYAVSGGTARSGRDYLLAPGQLTFGQSDNSAEIVISVLNNFVLDSSRELTVLLNSPSSGAKLGTPSSATIDIIDDELPLTPFLFAKLTPPRPRPATGSLRIHLEPPAAVTAGAGWRLPWELFWHRSDDILGDLDVGNYSVQFRSIVNYALPTANADTTNIPVSATVLTDRSYLYTKVLSSPTGSLTVHISPTNSDFAATGVPAPGWRLRGDQAYLASDLITNLPAGPNYILEFQPLQGWVAPEARTVIVLAGLENQVRAVYSPRRIVTVSTLQPIAIDYETITAGLDETLRRPLTFIGQLRTQVGYGSGIAIRQKVVLTAAHVLLDETGTNFVSEIEWFPERSSPEYEPRPLRAKRWYVFDKYLEARRGEREQGKATSESTPASQQWDVAAIIFDEPAVRHGESGFLVSDSVNYNWLETSHDNFLGGYPITGQNDGRLHTTQGSKYRFAHQSGWLYSSSDFIGYPGNSGGPLCVLRDQGTNLTYYPAAVYLGDFNERSLIRAIDSEVAELINRAASSAETGTNFTGGGVINFSAAASVKLGIQRLIVNLQPKEAVDKGAAWRVLAGAVFVNAFVNAGDVAIDLVPDLDYTVEFNPISGWFTPTNFPVNLPAGQDAELTVTYERADPVLAASAAGIFVSGPVGKVVDIEFTPVLDMPISWTKVQSIALGASPILVLGPPWANVPNGYYRLRWQP